MILEPKATNESIRKLLEHRWRTHDDFLRDFLYYATSERHWSLHIAHATEAHQLLIDALGEGGDFAAAVHEIAFQDLVLPVEVMPDTQRIQLLATILSDRDPKFKSILEDIYRSVDEAWMQLYKRLFAEKGWKLRPGITFEMLTMMLSTAAEGMAVRGLVTQDGLLSHGERRSLLGTICLAVLISCLDQGDSKTLEDLVRSMGDPLR